MKKILSLLTVLSLSLGVALATEPTQAFDFEDENLEAEFEQLNKIESFVESNQGVTLDELKANNNSLVDGITISGDAAASVAADELPLGIPAFWWGCVLAIVGVILVYVLTDQDKDQTKKALFGCLVFAGVYIISWVVLAALGTGFWWF